MTTTNYRSIEIGMLTTGIQPTVKGILLPPYQASVTLNSYCQTACMNVNKQS